MNIGLMGYYGFGNAGDEVILDTLRYFLAPHRVIAFPLGFLPTKEAIERLNMFDFLILGGGGLYNSRPPIPFDTFDQWMDYLKKPIGVLGIGVKNIDPFYMPITHQLINRAEFFVVRDEESRQLFGHPDVQIAPDLTFYKPVQVSPIQNLNRAKIVCGVNLRSMQRGVSDWINAVNELPCLKRALPFSTVPAYDDREPLSAIDPMCPDQFSITAYESLDLAVGTAFHSIVFAVQNGIPAIAINYHPKVGRLMRELGLDEYVLEWNEWTQLREHYDQVLEHHDVIRKIMVDYTAQAQEKLARTLQEVRRKIDTFGAHKSKTPIRIPTQPKVSIIVQCGDVKESIVIQTIRSCLDQTYRNLELIIIAARPLNGLAKILQDDNRAQLVPFAENSSDWVMTGLDFVSGDYVSWLQAGARYADDAVSLLTRFMEERPTVEITYADYFLTHNDLIERRIGIHAGYASEVPALFGPCFLVRFNNALEVRSLQTSMGEVSIGEEYGSERVLHIPHALLYRPASESEIHLYRSAIAYGRGQIEKGRQFLAHASRSDSKLIDSRQAREQIFNFYWDTPFEIIIESDRISFLETICSNLPIDTHELRVFRRFFIAQASVTEAFILREHRDMRKVCYLLLRSIWYDAIWLSNRGVLAVLAETLFGPIVRVYRQTRQQINNVFSRLGV